MKLKDLKPILKSQTGDIQWAIVWDATECKDLEYGCSIEYAIEHYGDREVSRIHSCSDNSGYDYLVINVI